MPFGASSEEATVDQSIIANLPALGLVAGAAGVAEEIIDEKVTTGYNSDERKAREVR